MTTKPAGRVIALEGLDGCGKSTFAAQFAQEHGAIALTTPDPALRAVRGLMDAWGPTPQKWLFYAATVIEVGQHARALAEAGHLVIIDRYWASTLAYALFEAGPTREAEVLRLLQPLEAWVPPVDETWWLAVPDAVRSERLAQRGASDADRASLAGADALRDAYTIALQRPSCGTVRAQQPTAAPTHEVFE